MKVLVKTPTLRLKQVRNLTGLSAPIQLIKVNSKRQFVEIQVFLTVPQMDKRTLVKKKLGEQITAECYRYNVISSSHFDRSHLTGTTYKDTVYWPTSKDCQTA